MNCIKVQNSLVEIKCSVCGCVQLGKALYVLNRWGVMYQIAGNIKVQSLQCVLSKGRVY